MVQLKLSSTCVGLCCLVSFRLIQSLCFT